MEISKTLFDEITKLSLKEWERIKSTVDYMFHLERERANKSLYLNPSEVKEKLKYYPIPIQIKY
ncbi:hypothetical protein [Fusobacterium sp. SYSU M8A802]